MLTGALETTAKHKQQAAMMVIGGKKQEVTEFLQISPQYSLFASLVASIDKDVHRKTLLPVE